MSSVAIGDERQVTHRPVSATTLIAATSIGNVLEFFDFTIFSFVGTLVAKLFFPAVTEINQLLLTFATFGVGFFMRPLGGLLIGIYADRAGRKAALVLTIAMMSLGSLMIGLAPTYATIGLASPLIIVVARLLQGFSAGGEVGASSVLMIESAPRDKRGYFTSWQFGSTSLGVALGAFSAILLSSLLTPAQFGEWGWRLPFLLGAFIAPVGYYIRRNLEETIHREASKTAAAGSHATALKPKSGSHIRHGLIGMVVIIGGITTSYIMGLFLPTYAIRQLGLPPTVGLSAGALVGLIGFIVAPFAGLAADRFGRKPLIVWSRVALVAITYPAFAWLVAAPDAWRLYTIALGLGALLSVQMTPTITLVTEIFPRRIRTTGMSVVYGFGVAIFGGFAQFMATLLMSATGSSLAPAWYLIACIVVSSIALPFCIDRTGEALD